VDLPIPGQPFTFGTLIDAQALGDLRALRGHGRRIARITFYQLLEVL
jgi:glucose-6-phosphate isomerase